jgi:hypothetical protein
MTPERLLRTAILPALAELATRGIPDTYEARRFVLAIALQESGLNHRRQVVGGAEVGPACSFWQFEKGGGCKGVLGHPAAAPHMAATCTAFNVSADPASLWAAIQYQDVVAATAARLLVYTLPSSLPTLAATGWAQYLSAWRPGKPRPESWAYAWNTATAAVDALGGHHG